MCTRGIHQGYLKKYGGFVFKQWKEKFFFLSMKGSLAICRDQDSLPEAEIPLHTSCKAIVKGSQISDLPRLPLGAQEDCCLALILTEGKLLLLLAADSEDCRPSRPACPRAGSTLTNSTGYPPERKSMRQWRRRVSTTKPNRAEVEGGARWRACVTAPTPTRWSGPPACWWAELPPAPPSAI
uniref:uncharacterized protein isoform X1 n=2 Tax=Pristiophorus japonicus TaxID=55135 RepID=UPI00398EC043